MSARARGSSPASHSPFGTDHAPASLRAQNGPPGWTSRTSSGSRRKSRMPALVTGTTLDGTLGREPMAALYGKDVKTIGEAWRAWSVKRSPRILAGGLLLALGV